AARTAAEVGEEHRQLGAHDVRCVEWGDHQRCVEVELQQGGIASGAFVGAAQRSGRGGEVAVTLATGANRLVHAAPAVEAAGTAVHVLPAHGSAVVGGILQRGHVDIVHGEVQVVAVRGALGRVGGHGQAGGAQGRTHVRAQGAAPAADVDLVAQVHQEGGGRDVGRTIAGADACAEQHPVEVGRELGDELPPRRHLEHGVDNEGAGR